MTFNTSVVSAEYRLIGNSKDCDCNLETFECSREQSGDFAAAGTSGVKAMAKYTLTPVYQCNDPEFPFKNTKYGLCYKTDPGPRGTAAAFQACNPPGHSFSLSNYPLCVVPAEPTPADAPAAPTVVPLSATFIDNEGGEHSNTPVVKIGDLYIVGVKQGGWYKLIAMNAQGIEVDSKYMA
jgi:hypothetical protein